MLTLTVAQALFWLLGSASVVQVSAEHMKPVSLRSFWHAKNTILHRNRQRHLQTEESCAGDPFLWHIYNSSDQHVGFGIGTMHLPEDVVTEPEAWSIIEDAASSSCAIYGEINLLDADVQAELLTCFAEVEANAVSISDIPDADLQERYIIKVDEIASELDSPLSSEVLLSLSLINIIDMIQAYNTPEYWPSYRQALNTGVLGSMDESILSLGRPAGGLEEVKTQCDLLADIYPTKEQFVVVGEEYVTDSWGDRLELALNSSYSELIASYKCGDLMVLEGFVSAEEEEAYYDAALNTALIDDRNKQMAERIKEILGSTTSKPLFAVGFAHWTYGFNSLEKLLASDGYRLERVANGTLGVEDLSYATCASSSATVRQQISWWITGASIVALFLEYYG